MGHRDVLPTFKSSPPVLIWRAGLIVNKPMKQSTGILVPQTLIDSSFRHLFTRTRSPPSVTWRQLHRTMVWKEQKTYIYNIYFMPWEQCPQKGMWCVMKIETQKKFMIWMRHKLQSKIKTPCCNKKCQQNSMNSPLNVGSHLQWQIEIHPW